jgi:excisionase family DNA binding protein
MAGNPLEWLTTAEVALLHGLGTKAVTRAIREGRLPATPRGHAYFIRRADAENWKPRGSTFKRPRGGR